MSPPPPSLILTWPTLLPASRGIAAAATRAGGDPAAVGAAQRRGNVARQGVYQFDYMRGAVDFGRSETAVFVDNRQVALNPLDVVVGSLGDQAIEA